MVRKSEKEILVSSIFQKSNEKIFLISSLASKNWLNQKNKEKCIKVDLFFDSTSF